MTKQIHVYQAQVKEYTGTIVLGSTTPSYDLETKPNVHYPIEHINEKLILKTAKKFVGKIFQTPPMFSAIKKDGVRLYNLARQGKEIKIDKREILIDSFEITSFNLPEISFNVTCSKGTYIRSLAHDFGKELNSGAHLSELRRIKIGDYSVKDSVKVMDFIRGI